MASARVYLDYAASTPVDERGIQAMLPHFRPGVGNPSRIPRFGLVDPDSVRRALRSETALVSVIHGNNEIGTVNPIREIAAICREREIALHTDAVQAASQLDLRSDELGADLISLGAHHTSGPQ